MEIKPDNKLITKTIWEIVTVSLFIVILGFLLQLLPSLDKTIDSANFIGILWKIVFYLIILLWIISIPISILWIKNLTYLLKKDEITIKKGILTKREQHIPYRMITDFMLERNLFDRWLGIASIKVQTAGQSQNQSGYEGKLAGLINWQELHRQLQNNLQTKDNFQTEDLTSPKIPIKFETNVLEELRQIRKILEKKK